MILFTADFLSDYFGSAGCLRTLKGSFISMCLKPGVGFQCMEGGTMGKETDPAKHRSLQRGRNLKWSTALFRNGRVVGGSWWRAYGRSEFFNRRIWWTDRSLYERNDCRKIFMKSLYCRVCLRIGRKRSLNKVLHMFLGVVFLAGIAVVVLLLLASFYQNEPAVIWRGTAGRRSGTDQKWKFKREHQVSGRSGVWTCLVRRSMRCSTQFWSQRQRKTQEKARTDILQEFHMVRVTRDFIRHKHRWVPDGADTGSRKEKRWSETAY